MHKILPSLCLAGFVLWIMPLGYFIKPSEQKLFCGGQRAMCMCSIFLPKAPDKAMEHGVVLKTGASNNKENMGGSNYFVSSHPMVGPGLQSTSVFEDPFLLYHNPFPAASEYVPKI
ncbi:MAG: hypothetical protein KGJ09_02425 [Candidatus Omnitrophica bacterium]|nr:hypothetical protein [Candidatus Omnitrophota bacterium]MDE2008914.1 hypothetical protein [Candidatus Omnitrophota bacterium]MDE2213523.1 hypothetical protein [Candidatus Omnitrophota bacterium]MDE2230576.1 hypothetical protein [Candidatus Omnitrophota bacterium]